jgi:uncharacterized protein (TIGR02145 family)
MMWQPLVLLLVISHAWQAPQPDVTDGRDGKRYRVIEIAGMQWLGGNLAYAAPGSSCPGGENDCPSGRLYPWDAAMTACPAGWHLSTEEEWQRLERHLGMSAEDLVREKLRGPGTGDALKAGGASGLAIPLSGWRRPDGSYVEGNGNDRAAALWTATRSPGGEAWHRDVSSARTGIWRSPVPPKYSLSVRCVRDARP